MILSLLGAGTSIASSIWGGIKAKNAAQKAEDALRQRTLGEGAWFGDRYNRDYTQTAEIQNLLRMAKDAGTERIAQARGVDAVMGGGGQATAIAQDSANKTLADQMGNAAALATNYKASLDQMHQNNMNAFTNQYMAMYNQQAKNATDAATEGMKAGMSLIGKDISSVETTGNGAFENLWKKNKAKEQEGQA